MEHPAKAALVALSRKYEDMGRYIDYMAFGSDRAMASEWPEEYLLPKHAWAGLCAVLNHMTVDEFRSQSKAMASQAEEMRFLGTWSKTQGIYRFDPSIYEELIVSPVEGDIPAAILQRLPEWCIYIETPSLQLSGKLPCRGCWVMNDFYAAGEGKEGVRELSIMFDPVLPNGVAAPMVSTLSLPLGKGSLADVMQAYRNESLKLLDDFQGMSYPGFGQIKPDAFELNSIVDDMSRIARQVVSLTLFICTQNDLLGKGDALPVRPGPQRNKRGVRLYGPSTPKVWDVGVRMGAALRKAQTNLPQSSSGDGGTVRPHIRRPHWHSFRTGRMKDDLGVAIPAEQRHLVVHFMPSLQVNFGPETTRDSLPAVIHPVKAPVASRNADNTALDDAPSLGV